MYLEHSPVVLLYYFNYWVTSPFTMKFCENRILFTFFFFFCLTFILLSLFNFKFHGAHIWWIKIMPCHRLTKDINGKINYRKY